MKAVFVENYQVARNIAKEIETCVNMLFNKININFFFNVILFITIINSILLIFQI